MIWAIVIGAWLVILAVGIFGHNERKEEARREGLDDL